MQTLKQNKKQAEREKCSVRPAEGVLRSNIVCMVFRGRLGTGPGPEKNF